MRTFSLDSIKVLRPENGTEQEPELYRYEGATSSSVTVFVHLSNAEEGTVNTGTRHLRVNVDPRWCLSFLALLEPPTVSSADNHSVC